MNFSPADPDSIATESNNAVEFHDYSVTDSDFLGEVLSGLSRTPKAISPKYLYDQQGSVLFDKICELPEYYPARTETGIFRDNVDDIAHHIGEECILVELGSGSSEKIRVLLESFRPNQYLGVDISKEFLLEATQSLADDYPWLEVHAVCADFSSELTLPPHCNTDSVVAFYPGSSIGNFHTDEAIAFMRQIHGLVGIGGQLLIGVDLKKDEQVLHGAYNDKAGVTAAFNLNLLHRINRELGADIDVEKFQHEAFYNESKGRVEMHLVSITNQAFMIGQKKFSLATGDSIHTESSYKYSLQEFAKIAGQSGFQVRKVWTDQNDYFSAQLLVAI